MVVCPFCNHSDDLKTCIMIPSADPFGAFRKDGYYPLVITDNGVVEIRPASQFTFIMFSDTFIYIFGNLRLLKNL